jgi:hypothetical protein
MLETRLVFDLVQNGEIEGVPGNEPVIRIIAMRLGSV